MNRRNQSRALREAKAIPRDLKAILENYIQVPALQGRRLRSGFVLDLPAATIAAQQRAQQQLAAEEEKKGAPDEEKGPPDEEQGAPDEQKGPPDDDEDVGDIQLGGRRGPRLGEVRGGFRHDLTGVFQRLVNDLQNGRQRTVKSLDDEIDPLAEEAKREGLPPNEIEQIAQLVVNEFFGRHPWLQDWNQRQEEEEPVEQLIENAERDYLDILGRYERMLELRQRTSHYRDRNIGQENIAALEQWNQEYRGRGVPEDVIDGIIYRNSSAFSQFPLLTQELSRMREERNRQGQEPPQPPPQQPPVPEIDEEDRWDQEFQRKRNLWGKLEEQAFRMPRPRWLLRGVHLLNNFGAEPAIIADMPNVNRQMRAIEFVDEYGNVRPPRIKDWRRCGRCQWEDVDNQQCTRYASCHRDNPSEVYCWQHARKAGFNYQRRRGIMPGLVPQNPQD